MQLEAKTRNRSWPLKIGYTDEFARCLSGTLLMLEAIRYAIRSGLRSYELLGAVEPWLRTRKALVYPCISHWRIPSACGKA
jgi:hypothetical protein